MLSDGVSTPSNEIERMGLCLFTLDNSRAACLRGSHGSQGSPQLSSGSFPHYGIYRVSGWHLQPMAALDSHLKEGTQCFYGVKGFSSSWQDRDSEQGTHLNTSHLALQLPILPSLTCVEMESFQANARHALLPTTVEGLLHRGYEKANHPKAHLIRAST